MGDAGRGASPFGKLPDRATLAPYLREARKVARNGFISWEGSRYSVHWKWVGRTVQVGQRLGTVEIWGIAFNIIV